MREITQRDVDIAVELLGLMATTRIAKTGVDVNNAVDETLLAIKPTVEAWVREHVQEAR